MRTSRLRMSQTAQIVTMAASLKKEAAHLTEIACHRGHRGCLRQRG
jgi:hypothetical protein